MIDFTVAIPTYNGASRLPALLDRVRSQIETDSFHWEVIVVDNNSSDATADVVKHYQEHWLDHSSLRYCFEPEQGLAYARQRAIDEAAGDLIGFLDDDNLPARDWVASAYAFAQTHPRAGGYGGQIHGDYETPPPPNFKRIQSFLAIRERGNTAHRYDAETLSLPPGAAMVVRQSVWQACVPSRLKLVGRVNGSSLSGEDYEALLHIYYAGWEIWYCPTMHTYHQIPAQRLGRDYLLSLVKGAGLCVCQLRLMYVPSWKKPLVIAKIMLGSMRRAVRHWLNYRQQFSSDLIAECEMAYFLSCIASPIYLLMGKFRRSPQPLNNTVSAPNQSPNQPPLTPSSPIHPDLR
ncbi:MAG: hormogonium polysaccharide biosynthesis glycosyltransferase HpsE [Elainellaceae cyanobacterium]